MERRNPLQDLLLNRSHQRVGFLVLLPDLLREFGVAPEQVISAAGMTMDSINHPDKAISYLAMGRLMTIAAEMTHCPSFGLELGKRITLSTLGPVGRLMTHAATVREALRDFVAHQHRNSHGGVAYLFEKGEDAIFGYAVYQPGMSGGSIISDGAAVAAYNFVRELVGDGATLISSVLLARAKPQDVEPYRRSFPAGVRFDQGQTAVVLAKGVLNRPVVGADSRQRAEALREVSARWDAGDLNLQERMRRHLRVALIRGNFSAIEVAGELRMSPRTLNRRLQAAGLEFQQVMDHARCIYVKQLLAMTHLEVSAISQIVGYSTPSVLSSAFARWTGQTPTEWRAHAVAEGVEATH